VTDRKENPRLKAVFKTRVEFLDRYLEAGPGGVFWPAPDEERALPPEARPGALLSVTFCFEDGEAEFHLHARVIERRESRTERGLLLEFLAEEAPRRELVLAFARRESVAYRKRQTERVPCVLPVRVRTDGGKRFRAAATNISERGVHLSAEETILKDTIVELSIAFPSEGIKVQVRGRVTGTIRGGPQRGAGIEFLFESAAQRTEMVAQVARIRRRPPGG
jgi:hypothetical protein